MQNDQSKNAAVLAIAEQTADPLMQACQRLERRAKRLAESLSECAGYIASVRTDRKIRDQHGNDFVGQTLEWAEGALEIAERANVELEAYDEENETLLPNPANEPRR